MLPWIICSDAISRQHELHEIQETMRYILTIVEQLDRAARELSTDHPINSRLALVLIDNATELVVYRQCTDRLEHDNFWAGIHKATQAIARDNPEAEIDDDSTNTLLRPDQRKKIRGRHLNPKLHVLEEMGDLTGVERQFISIAHGYRNELYHVGLRHDPIIRAVAGQYFLLCCDLFVRMGQLSSFNYSWSSTDKYTSVARRYLPTRNGKIDFFSVDKSQLADKLRRALPDGLPDLSAVLADNAHECMLEVQRGFDFLVQDNPLGLDAQKVLEVAQWQHDLAKAVRNEDLIGHWADPDYQEGYARIAADLEADWTQRHAVIPIESWTRRATSLGNETDPLKAMERYKSLRDSMSYLEDSIISAAIDLDQAIQMEIDMARGK